MPNWTHQQQAVIDSSSRKIICSAAAGSGKTAVMIERIIRMLREGADPKSFLIMTFTNAAASEMKQKIYVRLREGRNEKNLRSALDKIDLMVISTIHSFCQDLIREEFQAAGADPFFTVCEQARAKSLFSEAFRSACASLQKEKHTDYLYWKKCFTRKDTEEIVRSVHTYMMSLPDPFEWMERSCEDVPDRIDPDHPWFRMASEMVMEKTLAAQVILRRQFLMFDEPEHGEPYRAVWKADSELFHVKQCWAEGKTVPEEALTAPFMRLPVWSKVNSLEAAWKERYQELRQQLKTLNAEIEPLIRQNPETVARDFGNLRASLRGLKMITLRTAERFAAKKAKLRLLDFSDLEHFALKVLRTEPAASAVRRRYREVFVDECQDVSQVQDEIIQSLYSDKGHLFMVGDVKQSIYRFRLADPGQFLKHMAEYESGDPEKSLLKLQTNFRSRPEILETANTVFRDIMKMETAEVDYTDGEALIPGRSADGFHPVQVDVLEPDPERTRLESAADDLAQRIRELQEEQFHYRDMVILMPRVSSDGPKLKELLEERRIPVFFDGGVDFYERQEIAVFRQLLTYIVNPTQDESLLTVLKSAPFFFKEEELARVRLQNPGKDVPFRKAFEECLEDPGVIGERCREAAEQIAKWRLLEKVTPMGHFVRILCNDSHQMAMAGARPDGKTAKRNLHLFCCEAEEAERAGVYSLRRFLSFVSERAGGGDQRSATPLAEGDDVVRIMTMHKSKGLQFPVVFCLGLDGSLSGRAEGSVMTDADLGICLKYKRPEARLSRNTAASAIFSWKKEKEQRAERIRLLYVAMTRAQERMFLVGVGEDHALWSAPPGEHRVLSAVNYMDWIVPALQDAAKLSTGFPHAENPWKISFFSPIRADSVENTKSYPLLETWLDSLLSAPPVEGMWKDRQIGPLLSKMQKKSVTSLLKNADRDLERDPEGEEEETPEGKRAPDTFSAAFLRNQIIPYPSFMVPPPEKQGAWRGTLVHRFLSLVDLDRIRKAGGDLGLVLETMKEEMLAKNVFRPEEAAVIRVEDAAEFFRSPLGIRMLASREVRREWGFNLYRPDRDLLVQGIVDCVFLEEDGWVLVDYKTDRVENADVFVEIYRPQLKWYSEAIGELSGKRVKETWLYALSRHKAYPT